MKFFTFLLLTLFFLSCEHVCKAQTINRYKIEFLKNPSEDVKLYLQKISNMADVEYSTMENSAIISTSALLDYTIMDAKFSKFQSPVKSITLIQNNPKSNKIINQPSPLMEKEINDKASKQQQKQLEIKSSLQPYKRF